jgi:general secretion pathway protein D
MINKRYLIVATQIALMSGCTTLQGPNPYKDLEYKVKASTLSSSNEQRVNTGLIQDVPHSQGAQYQKIASISDSHIESAQQNDLLKPFSSEPTLTVTTEKLPLEQFINYVFGEMLSVSYIVSEDIQSRNKSVTLNIRDKISQQELLKLLDEQLQLSGNEIVVKDGIYYVMPLQNGGSRYAIGIGADVEDIPTNANAILQIVPVTYDLSNFAIKSIQDFTPANVRYDNQQGSLFIRGRYADVARTLDVFRYLDKPANRGKHVAMFDLTYIDGNSFTEQIQKLLQSEGISASTSSDSGASLVFVPLDNIGSVAVFSSSSTVLDRVTFWAKQLDKPAKGSELNYFIYYPKFARASDLAESLSPLLGGAVSGGSSSSQSSKRSSPNSGQGGSTQINTEQSGKSNSVLSVSKGLVVDERSNAMIFNMSASEYNQLLPLIKQLDVLPKQILLEVVIAEVTLSGDFKKGVEFFFSKGNNSIGTKGAFGVADIGGLNYLWKSGQNQVQISAFEENKLVNVLSNPSLLVRDGVSATINIGTDIPVVTSTVDTEGDGTKVTETIQYRKTGVDLSVTPTVNSRGVVIMNISQNISNQTDTSAGSSSPSIFERSLDTEVIADSGQTIILGGIITENKSTSETKVPLLGDIPVLGELFRYDGDNTAKTELVMLVTPRIIERSDEWQSVIEKFGAGFENVKLPNYSINE